jgi:2-oxoglutarate dehydrogenase complex dehydrogenase (E1) component-like enzyme
MHNFRNTKNKTNKQYVENQHSNLLRLIDAYRRFGHLAADLDPLGLQQKM